jgi:hypothetical protein
MDILLRLLLIKNCMSSSDLKSSEVSENLFPVLVQNLLNVEVRYNVYLRSHTVGNLKSLISENEGIPVHEIV